MLLAIVGPAVLLCERYILAHYIAYEAQYGKLHRRRVPVMADDKGLEQLTQLLHRSGRSAYRFLTIACLSYADRTSRKFTLRSGSKSASTAGLR